MSKKIATDLTRQESVDFDPNEDVRAEDFKRLFKAQNFVGVHKGMRFGGVTYDGTITGADTIVRNHKFITLAGYFQRPIDGEGYSLQYDFYAKNITITANVYNVDTDTQIATHTMDRPESSLGWEQFTFNIPVKDATQNGTLTGDEALIEIRFEFTDNGATWELGHLDVTEEIIEDTDRLIFRRTTVAINVQNDGTLEVSDADTLNFGGGLTASNPSGSTAKVVGPAALENGSQVNATFDEINFKDQAEGINLTSSTTSITDPSGESGTRVNIDVDLDSLVTTSQFRASDFFQSNQIRADGSGPIDITDNTNSDTVEVNASSFDGSSFIKGAEVRNRSSGGTLPIRDGSGSDSVTTESDVFSATNDLIAGRRIETDTIRGDTGGTISFESDTGGNATVTANKFDAPFVEGDDVTAINQVQTDVLQHKTAGDTIDVKDGGTTSTAGHLASDTTNYAIARGMVPDGGSLTVNTTINCSVTYPSTGTIRVSFDDAFGSSTAYAPVGVAELDALVISSTSTGSCDLDTSGGGDPGEFAIIISRWTSGQV